MIVLRNISKIFDQGKASITAVDNVNLTVEQGQIYGIIGYSGAGKSTLIRLLNGLEKPTNGSVVINGQDIAAARGEALRQARLKISMRNTALITASILRAVTVMNIPVTRIPTLSITKSINSMRGWAGQWATSAPS